MAVWVHREGVLFLLHPKCVQKEKKKKKKERSEWIITFCFFAGPNEGSAFEVTYEFVIPKLRTVWADFLTVQTAVWTTDMKREQIPANHIWKRKPQQLLMSLNKFLKEKKTIIFWAQLARIYLSSSPVAVLLPGRVGVISRWEKPHHTNGQTFGRPCDFPVSSSIFDEVNIFFLFHGQ